MGCIGAAPEPRAVSEWEQLDLIKRLHRAIRTQSYDELTRRFIVTARAQEQRAQRGSSDEPGAIAQRAAGAAATHSRRQHIKQDPDLRATCCELSLERQRRARAVKGEVQPAGVRRVEVEAVEREQQGHAGASHAGS